MSIPSEITKLIESSGNNFHAKVARWFSTNDWRVVVSPYYMDQTQNKAREIDLIVEKDYQVKDAFGKNKGKVTIRLFVECKYIASYSVFWFAQKDTDAAKKLVYSNRFRENGYYTEDHHYLRNSQNVAKLFSSEKGKNGNTENEPFYKALNQVLNAMVAMRHQQITGSTSDDYQESPMRTIEYPVVVCDSFANLYKVNFFDESQPEEIKDHFQLEVQYAYVDRSNRPKNDYFLIDMVDFQSIKSFISNIDKDSEIAITQERYPNG
jgi:hypothetical protein